MFKPIPREEREIVIIEIDTSEPISNVDSDILRMLTAVAVPAPKEKAHSTQIVEKVLAPTPDSASEDGKTAQDAVDAATVAIKNGKTAAVKAALAKAGVKRVSELPESAIDEFVKEVTA